MKTTFTTWPSVIFLWMMLGLMGIAAMLGVPLGDRLFSVTCVFAIIATGMTWWTGSKGADWRIAGWAIAFVALTVMSFLRTSTATVGLGKVQATFAMVLFFLWAVQLKEKEKLQAREWISAVLPWIAIVACVIGVLVYALQPFPRFVGTFFDSRSVQSLYPNAFAGFLLLCWPFAFLQPIQKSWLRALVLSILFASLFLTYSRAAWIVFVIQAAMLFSQKKPDWKHLGTVLLSTVLIVGAISIARSISFTLPSPAARITFTDTAKTVPVSERRELWNSAIGLTKERPMWGWGPGSFVFAGQRYQQHPFAIADDAHNLLLTLSAERGIPAVLAFVIVVFLCLRQAWRKRSDMLIFGCVLAIVGVLLHSMLDRDMLFLAIALPFWIFLGLVTSHEESQTTRTNCLAIVTSILAFLLLLSGFLQQKGDAALGEGQDLLTQGRIEESVSVLNAYTQQNTQDPRGWILLGNALMMNDEYGPYYAIDAYDAAYALGRYNYPNILEGYVRVATMIEVPAVITDRIVDIEQMLDVHIQAIRSNDHYAALAFGPDSVSFTLEALETLIPEKAARYAELRKEVDAAAAAYRAQKTQDAQGILW